MPKCPRCSDASSCLYHWWKGAVAHSDKVTQAFTDDRMHMVKRLNRTFVQQPKLRSWHRK